LKESCEGKFVSQKEKTPDRELDNNNESYQLYIDHKSAKSATGYRLGWTGHLDKMDG
jgi:hypothetical protein